MGPWAVPRPSLRLTSLQAGAGAAARRRRQRATQPVHGELARQMEGIHWSQAGILLLLPLVPSLFVALVELVASGILKI
jgi:hypothetical protein